MDLRQNQITVGELLQDPRARAVFQRRFGKWMKHPMVQAARSLTLGQLAEMFFLVITTSILVKSGIKKTLIYGLVALFVRYFAFFLGAETDAQWFYYIGIIVHGLIFGLFYVGGQVYTDQVAPKEMKARAQGLLFFLVWGIGFLIGTLWNGWLIDLFRDGDKCDWPVLFLISSGGSLILLLLFVFAFKPVELKREEV